jgi:hypothetical protein
MGKWICFRHVVGMALPAAVGVVPEIVAMFFTMGAIVWRCSMAGIAMCWGHQRRNAPLWGLAFKMAVDVGAGPENRIWPLGKRAGGVTVLCQQGGVVDLA